MTAASPDWIAIDWGTTRLRAFALTCDGVTLAEASSDDGMSRLSPAEFEPALLRLVGPWLTRPTPVLACGMVGSRQGWVEAPYRPVPCAPLDPARLIPVPTKDPRLHLRLVPGLSQQRPADVMRGEETQIAGALALHPAFDGVICLPGTHCKWAQISAGEVVGFQTFMTGELFALLSQGSVLRHAMPGDGWDAGAFAAALSDAQSHPASIAARLFALRAESLLSGLSPAAARARLSGLLIGIELAAARPWWLGQQVILVGAEPLCTTYATALTLQGTPSRTWPAAACVIAGLATALERR
ncbi:2-dehydro-3-deoxygalactonokinase [Paracoccaceae bacterium Fryx2]|nr:2-dehydro-3-deoxygalactonokinase [Paracoccaceae bacterium Fryx2]